MSRPNPGSRRNPFIHRRPSFATIPAEQTQVVNHPVVPEISENFLRELIDRHDKEKLELQRQVDALTASFREQGRVYSGLGDKIREFVASGEEAQQERYRELAEENEQLRKQIEAMSDHMKKMSAKLAKKDTLDEVSRRLLTERIDADREAKDAIARLEGELSVLEEERRSLQARAEAAEIELIIAKTQREGVVSREEDDRASVASTETTASTSEAKKKKKLQTDMSIAAVTSRLMQATASSASRATKKKEAK